MHTECKKYLYIKHVEKKKYKVGAIQNLKKGLEKREKIRIITYISFNQD